MLRRKTDLFYDHIVHNTVSESTSGNYCDLTIIIIAVVVVMRPSYKPHYASCPSVRPSVCLLRVLTRKKRRKPQKLPKTFPGHDTSKWSADFQTKKSTLKVTRRQKLPEIVAYLAYTFTYER